MFTCASCSVLACKKGEKEGLPKNCPMNFKEEMEDVFREYQEEENSQFYIELSKIESKGYCEWPRVKEVIETCKAMNYKKVGVAFCVGLKKEAKIFCDLLQKNDLIPVSIICKNGGFDKATLGIEEEFKLNGGSGFEAGCNPIGQAYFLNKEKTDFNVSVGLCVGHDSLLFKYSEAFCTVLVAKDRVLAHNPVGALYCAEGYLKKKL